MLERFTRERQRESKGALFNLEEEDELTHYGQSLSKLDDFDNIGLGLDDDEDAGQIDSRTVQKVHFGGFESDEDEDEDEDDEGVSRILLFTHVSLLDSVIFSQSERKQRLKSWPKLSQKAKSIKSVLFNSLLCFVDARFL